MKINSFLAVAGGAFLLACAPAHARVTKIVDGATLIREAEASNVLR